MNRLFIFTVLWFAFVLSAFGLSEQISVTPDSLDQGTYVFSVATNAVQTGVDFSVTIVGKKSATLDDCHVGLSIVNQWSNGSEISPAKPSTPVTVKKANHIWKVDFIVSNEMLTNTNLCCVFTVDDNAITQDGKRIAMPSCEFYEIKLRDFLKR